MKLTETERRALSLLRQLHERQREKILSRMQREVIANKLVKRISGSRNLEIAGDRDIERAFGAAPTWKAARQRKGE